MASVSEQKIEPLEKNTSLTPVQSLRSEKLQGKKGKVRSSGVKHTHPHNSTQRMGVTFSTTYLTLSRTVRPPSSEGPRLLCARVP